jgi:hypothetical protein
MTSPVGTVDPEHRGLKLFYYGPVLFLLSFLFCKSIVCASRSTYPCVASVSRVTRLPDPHLRFEADNHACEAQFPLRYLLWFTDQAIFHVPEVPRHARHITLHWPLSTGNLKLSQSSHSWSLDLNLLEPFSEFWNLLALICKQTRDRSKQPSQFYQAQEMVYA